MGTSNLFDETLANFGRDKVCKKIQLANLKRKIHDREIPPEVIAKKYRVAYPNNVISSDLVWREPFPDCYVLFDVQYQTPRFVVSNSSNALLVPPPGKKPVKFRYKSSNWTPSSTPSLTGDALRSIFRHLHGWEIMNCRLVCREWNRVATNTHSLWTLKNVPRVVAWTTSSVRLPFRRYVQTLFLGIKPRHMAKILFKKPDLFVYICELFLGKTGSLRVRSNTLRYGGFSLERKTARLTFQSNLMELGLFLEAFRQRVCLGK